MRYTENDFAAALPSLRPALIKAACRQCRCPLEDAEDLVSQTVLIALRHFSEYQPETGREGLQRWLQTILNRVIQEERTDAARHVQTVSLEEAVSLPAPASFSEAAEVQELFLTLPRYQRLLVNEWLAGYSQREIARRYRLHRNTVATRLETAFATLRAALPNAGALTYSEWLLSFCSHVSLYTKPGGVWRSWFCQHPPEVHFARYRQSIRARREREKAKEEGVGG